MARKGRAGVAISPSFFWRLGLMVLACVCGALAALLWLSGVDETRLALADGRRILMPLDAPPPPPEPEKTEIPPDAAADTADTTALMPSVAAPEGASAALIEQTKDGALPIIGHDGTKPWRYYAKSFTRQGSTPMVAVIITGLGENKTVTENALKLPENIALGFSPYAHDAANWVSAARATGHEIMVDLPLEPADYPASDPGPYGLLTAKEAPENELRLRWLMSRFAGYTGFAALPNEAFTSNSDAFKPVLQTLAKRGLLLALPQAPVKAETSQVIDASGAPVVIDNLVLDEELTPGAITARLDALEQMAKNHGSAIGLAQAYPITIEQLNAWAAGLQEKGLVLVPVSFIAKQKFR